MKEKLVAGVHCHEGRVIEGGDEERLKRQRTK
jgi:hypothetical protein